MISYTDDFAFDAVPFSKDIDDDKLWLPPSKKSIVSDLVECVQERKHAVVTGESGAGKTCVTRAVRHALGNQAVRLTYCHNVTLGRRDFYRHLCHALGVPYGSTAGDVLLSVTRHVEDLARERVFPVFLVDEAHMLHQDTLDHLLQRRPSRQC
jgi:general secretion pathway protein A